MDSCKHDARFQLQNSYFYHVSTLTVLTIMCLLIMWPCADENEKTSWKLKNRRSQLGKISLYFASLNSHVKHVLNPNRFKSWFNSYVQFFHDSSRFLFLTALPLRYRKWQLVNDKPKVNCPKSSCPKYFIKMAYEYMMNIALITRNSFSQLAFAKTCPFTLTYNCWHVQ